jgi:16S rRNA (guanine966-N2)-methyltransferase
MRVVAGSIRGRKLVAPDGLNVRPTAERVRQATFNALEHRGAVRDAQVVDLFAGSGALGIEALSRGAAHVTFVEQDKAAVACIRRNLEHVGMAAHATIVRADVARWARGGPPVGAVDLLFADPPYTFEGWPDLLRAMRPGLQRDDPEAVGIAVLETPGAIEPGPGWEILRQQRYGGTVVTLAIPALLDPVAADDTPTLAVPAATPAASLLR